MASELARVESLGLQNLPPLPGAAAARGAGAGATPAQQQLVQLAERQQLVAAPRLLLLDGNPLGRSGVCCLLQAIADCGSGTGSGPAGGAAGTSAPGAAGSSAALLATGSALQLPVLLSVQGCLLMARESGMRAGLCTGSASPAASSPAAPTFLDVLEAPPAAAAKQQAKRKAAAKAGKSKSKGRGRGKGEGEGKGAASAVPLVVTEAADGLDYSRPAGRYSLELAHPSSRCVAVMLGSAGVPPRRPCRAATAAHVPAKFELAGIPLAVAGA
jgi:hypothetical protein